jgi:hypothetical protein
LKALIDKGWVKVHNFGQSKQKLRYAYLLTPQGIIEKARLTGGFLRRKLQEFDALTAEIEALKIEVYKHGYPDSFDQRPRIAPLNPQFGGPDPMAAIQRSEL